MVKTVNHSVVVDGVRSFLDDLRDQVSTESGEVSIPTPSEIADKIANWIKTEEKPYLSDLSLMVRESFLHTGLGRAPLAKSAIESVQEDFRRVTPVSRWMSELVNEARESNR